MRGNRMRRAPFPSAQESSKRESAPSSSSSKKSGSYQKYSSYNKYSSTSIDQSFNWRKFESWKKPPLSYVGIVAILTVCIILLGLVIGLAMSYGGELKSQLQPQFRLMLNQTQAPPRATTASSPACNFSGVPEAYQIQQCERAKRSAQCSFDASSCNGGCDMGFAQDHYGCPISCDCAMQGTFQADIAFSPVNLQRMLIAYISEQDSSVTISTSGSGNFKNIWDIKVASRIRVPFSLTAETDAKPETVSAINSAIEQLSSQTCVDFFPRTDEADFIEFSSTGIECSSSVGKIGGRQTIFVADGCVYTGIVLHLLMHALGFWHEESRPDRDTFVSIQTSNIAKEDLVQFQAVSRAALHDVITTYDTKSIMHSDGFFYSTSGQPTIVDRETQLPLQTQRESLSSQDVLKVNILYDCSLNADVASVAYGDHWGSWKTWSSCATSCGQGRKVRIRECLDVQSQIVYHHRCQGSNQEAKHCSSVPCSAGMWGEWSSCSTTCGIGQMHRKSCCYPNEEYEVSTCSLLPCPSIDKYVWTAWLPWTGCSRTCGSGYMRRRRSCVTGESFQQADISSCPATIPSSFQYKICSTKTCGVKDDSAEWGDWSVWSECSLTCGDGKQTRCQNDERQCFMNDIDFVLSDQPGSVCRVRTCSGEGSCSGEDTEEIACAEPCTAAAGNWDAWSSWSTCDASCSGERRRSKTCRFSHNQIALTCQGGTNKAGKRVETETCTAKICLSQKSSERSSVIQPENDDTSDWTKWSPWGRCSKSCEGGIKWRNRKCLSHMIGNCNGRSSQLQICNDFSCEQQLEVIIEEVVEPEAGWGAWTDWSDCSPPCVGNRTRYRLCFDTAGNLADDCPGTNDTRQDVTSKCPSEVCATQWGQWSAWGACRSCLDPHRSRNRTCMGSTCSGDTVESEACTLECPEYTVFNDAHSYTPVGYRFCADGKLLVGDFNGDMIDDLVCLRPDGYLIVKVARTNGRRTLLVTEWEGATPFCITGFVLIVDSNGDGSDDLLCHAGRYLTIMLADADGSFAQLNITEHLLPEPCTSTSVLLPGKFDTNDRFDFFCTNWNRQTMLRNPFP